MPPFSIFSLGIVFILVLSTANWLWSRRQPTLGPENRRLGQDARLLWFFVYVAALCLLSFIAFVFGAR